MALILKNRPFLCAFILVTTYVTLALKANAQGPIPTVPTTTPEVAAYCDPDGDLVACAEVVNGAKTWEDAMTRSINAAIDRLNKGNVALDNLEAKLDIGVEPEKKKNIVNICSDSFDTVMASLRESLDLVTNDPTLGLNNKISAAFSGFSNCIDVLTEDENQKREIVELTGLNVMIQQQVYISLMVANRDPRVKTYYKKLEQGIDE